MRMAEISGEKFDVLVIGGGITGCGVARDAAMRGLKVALIERDDFGSGTSGRSSRLIHGGIRYLEQGQLHLVHESIRERQTLPRIAPHLVTLLAFTWPIHRGRQGLPREGRRLCHRCLTKHSRQPTTFPSTTRYRSAAFHGPLLPGGDC